MIPISCSSVCCCRRCLRCAHRCSFYSAVSCWRLLLRCSRWIWSRRSRSRGVSVENLPGRGFGATCCAWVRHNSANATRWQSQFARLLSHAHALKINRDHRARLVSSNRESFAYTNSNTILLLYAGDIRVPPRVPASGPEPCGGNKRNFFFSPEKKALFEWAFSSLNCTKCVSHQGIYIGNESLFSRHGLRPSIFSGPARIEGVRVEDSGIPIYPLLST